MPSPLRPSPVAVRPGTQDDAAEVWPLVRALAQTYTPRAEDFPRRWSQVLASPAATALVAEHDGRVVGLAVAHAHVALNADGPVVWLEEVVVDEALRRRGVGATLVGAVEAWARAQGARHVALATRRALPFYVALGFAESAAYVRKHLAPASG